MSAITKTSQQLGGSQHSSNRAIFHSQCVFVIKWVLTETCAL